MSDYIRFLVKPGDSCELSTGLATHCDKDICELEVLGAADRIEFHENGSVTLYRGERCSSSSYANWILIQTDLDYEDRDSVIEFSSMLLRLCTDVYSGSAVADDYEGGVEILRFDPLALLIKTLNVT